MTTLPPIVRPPVQTQQSLRPLFKNSEMCDWSGPANCCSMSKQLKGGYLLRYKKKLFGKAWKEEWVVLYENSHLVWYKHREKSCPCPEGGLILAEAPELLAVGLWTLRIPSRPELPEGCHSRQLMAFGTKGRRVEWFLAKSEEEVNEWMTAISNTLPPPPTIQKPKPSSGLFSNSKSQQNNKSQPQNNKSGDLISSSCSCPCQVNYSSSGATTTNSNNTSMVREKSSYNYGKNYGKDYTTPLALGSAFYWNQMGIGYNWGWGAGWMTNDSLNSYNVAGDTFSSSALSSGSGLGSDFSAHSNSVADHHSIGGLGGSAFDDIDSASSAFDGFGDFGF